MRRIFLLLVIVGLVGAGAWYGVRTTAAAAPYTPSGPGDTYVALGDSLAAGFTVDKPADAYVARVTSALQTAAPIQVRNFAVPGETSASLLARQLPQALAFIKAQRAAGKRVSPITLDIGGNDGLAARRASNAERTQMIAAIERNLDTALSQLARATTTWNGRRTADIAIMTYYNPYPGDAADPATLAYWTAQLNAAIVRVAAKHGVAVADVAGAFAGGKVYRYTYITTGDIHANSDGHALIAERFLDALQYAAVQAH